MELFKIAAILIFVVFVAGVILGLVTKLFLYILLIGAGVYVIKRLFFTKHY